MSVDINKVKELIKGNFDSLSDENKEYVMELVAYFHYRTGKSNPDGSLGEIRITLGELNNLLAFVINGKNN